MTTATRILRVNINLQKIQIKHEKSQQDAFEELCCELFLIKGKKENWHKGAEFICKNGAGGDGGVESYWRFKNNAEYGMQAKFSNKLESSLWTHINNSVKKALRKHPNLTKYYVYAPFNKTDQRDDAQKSQQETWDEYIEKWKKESGDTEFIWIDKTQIIQQLTIDTPEHRGLVKYWFDEKALSRDWFKNHIKETILKAHERYSQELNVKTSTLETLVKFTKSESSLEDPREKFEKIQNSLNRIQKK